MKIVFYTPYEHMQYRKDIFKYSNINNPNGCGFSGTDTAVIETCKFLADNGHTVWIYGATTETFIDYGIIMVSIKDVATIPWKDIDYFSPIFYLYNSDVWNVINIISPKRTKIFLTHHCHIEHKFTKYLEELGFSVVNQYVSNFVKRNAYPYNTNYDIISNGLHEIFFNRVDLSKKQKGVWVNCSIFERGGEMCLKIFEYVRSIAPNVATEINFASYMNTDIEHFINLPSYIKFHGSIPKSKIIKLLDKAEYFIYPQILSNNNVTHDTYSTVILEAISRGIIVIAWDVAGLRENFGDHIILIPTPKFPNYDPYAKQGNNPLLKSFDSIQKFADVITYLENNPYEKTKMIEKNLLWVKDKTWNNIGSKVEKLLLKYL